MTDFPTSLRDLVAEATSGPWSAFCDENGDYWPNEYDDDDEPIPYWVVLSGADVVMAPNDMPQSPKCAADAKLVVFLANRALAIADLAEAAHALVLEPLPIIGDGTERNRRRDALRAALAKLNDTGETK